MSGPDLATLARRFCLQNAVQHGGKAEPRSLAGRILGAHPEFRADPRAVAAALAAAAEAVNALSPEEQKAALAVEAPDLADAPRKEKRAGLRELPNVRGKVVMRFAPNPNGPLSLGHSRGVSLLAEYWQMHDAELILRFDDTDPQVKPPLWDPARGWDGYRMIQEDFEWLTGRTPSRTVTASDRVPVYHDAGRELIRRGGAYVCACEAEAFRGLKAKGVACPHRDAEPAANLEAFERMVKGELAKGAAVVRVKTDIRHKDPALRDWTAFRVVAADAAHPRERTGDIPRHPCWPLLDFESAIEDHLQGVTHVIRGKDLMDSTKKQGFLYGHMGWTYPETLYWGRVSVHEFGKFSTSMMRRAIEAGRFSGWDDPRLPTLAALRRRGYRPEALRRFWVGLGLTEKDIAVSMANLEAENQKAVDDGAARYFFVPEPHAVSLSGADGRAAEVPRHPSHPERGRRRLAAEPVVHIPGAEKGHPTVRLKDLGNVVLAGGTAFFTGTEMDRGVPILQWLPKSQARPFTVVKPGILADDAPDGAVPPLNEVAGLVEAAALAEVGRVVQFERFGFVRLETPERGVWLHG